MRLIDADILFDAMEETEWYNNADRDEIAERLIMDAPSIDIVRCSECKYRKPSGYVGSIKTYECDITGFRMHDLTNHFCSYGEREGER